jgi:hypothetical protein
MNKEELNKKREAIRKGLEPFQPERSRILALLKDWASEEDFDREFRGNDFGFGLPRARGIPGHALILGGMHGYGTLPWWIDLLQHMVFLGDVKQEKRNGAQFYLAAKGSKEGRGNE